MEERKETRIGEEIDPIGFVDREKAQKRKEELYSSRPDILVKEMEDAKLRMQRDNQKQHYYLVCISHFNGERNWEEFNNREEFRNGVMMILSINHEDVNNDGEKVDIAMKAIEKNFDDPDLYDPFDVEDYIVEVL